MTNVSTPKIEKRLKRDKFDILDAAISAIMFILLQYVIVVVFYMFPPVFLKSKAFEYIGQIAIEGLFLLSVYLTAVIRDTEWVTASGMREKFNSKVCVFGLVVAAVSLLCFARLADLFIYFIQSLGYRYKYTAIDVSNFGFFLLSLVVHCAVPAFTEELLFRGTICSGLEKKNKHLAVFVSALLFMLMHSNPLQTVHQFILGIVYGYIFVYTHNIWISVFAHFLNNGLTVTMYYISTLVYPEAILEDGTIIGFEPVSGSQLAINIVTGIVLAVVGALLMVYILKALKKHFAKKEEISENSEEVKLETETVKEQDKNDKFATNIFNDKQKRQKLWITLLFIIVGVILVKDWVTALISGFAL